MQLTPTPPYDLSRTARLMARYHDPIGYYDPQGRTYWRAVTANEEAHLFCAQQPEPDAPVTVHFIGEDPPPATRQAAVRMLATQDDFRSFYALARADDRLWRVVQPLYGLHHLQSETVFEALMLVIIEQQISLKAALRAQRALSVTSGRFVNHDGRQIFIFPGPSQIADIPPDDLHRLLKITRRRVAVMQVIAADVHAGRLDLEALRQADPETAYNALMAIKGVGHWTATWTLIRGLGHYTYAAHNDVALRDAVAHYFYDTEERVSADTAAALFEHYAPYAGLAAFYTLMRWAVEKY